MWHLHKCVLFYMDTLTFIVWSFVTSLRNTCTADKKKEHVKLDLHRSKNQIDRVLHFIVPFSASHVFVQIKGTWDDAERGHNLKVDAREMEVRWLEKWYFFIPITRSKRWMVKYAKNMVIPQRLNDIQHATMKLIWQCDDAFTLRLAFSSSSAVCFWWMFELGLKSFSALNGLKSINFRRVDSTHL